MSLASRAGTLSSAALMMVAVRLSGRKSTSDPLNARPIGERAVETMTASGMTDSSVQVQSRYVPACGGLRLGRRADRQHPARAAQLGCPGAPRVRARKGGVPQPGRLSERPD